MKKIRIYAILLLFCVLGALFSPAAQALDTPVIEGSYSVLLETNTDTVLHEQASTVRTAPASLTKIMTVLLAVEAIEKQTVVPSGVVATPAVEVTAHEGYDFDMREDGSTASILLGEVMTLEDLLYCAMLSSANEACNIIAEFIGGSVSGFVDSMNQRALELGCTGTHFANTHGLPNDDHYSTAWDIALITREAVTHPLFREICSTKTKTLNATNLSAARELYNTNSLINANDHYPGDYLYKGAAGVKTGFTNAAGYCLSSIATKEEIDNIQLLSVVLHSPAYDDNGDGYIDQYCNFSDTITLFDWGFNNWSYREVIKSTDIIASVPVSMGDGTDSVSVRPSTSIVRLLPNDEDLSTYQKIPTIYALADGGKLEAPISAGEVLGEISIVKDGKVVGTASLVATTEVALSRVRYMRTEIRETLSKPIVLWSIIILVALIVLYATVVVRYRRRRREYLRQARRARVARQIAEGDEDVREWYDTGIDRAKVRKAPPRQSAGERRSREGAARVKAASDDQGFQDYFEEFFGEK